MSTRNDILNTLGDSVGVVLEGTNQMLVRYAFDADRKEGADLEDMAFEVLCALHERMTKDQIRQVLETRITD